MRVKITSITAAAALFVVCAIGPVQSQPELAGGVAYRADKCSFVNTGIVTAQSITSTCGDTDKERAASKVLLATVRDVVREQRLDAQQFESLRSELNPIAPTLVKELAGIDDLRASLADLKAQIGRLADPGGESADKEVVEAGLRAKYIAGFPLTECGCHKPYDEDDPMDMFRDTTSNSQCLSGLEQPEACNDGNSDTCSVTIFFIETHHYPPWRRVCAPPKAS